MVGRYVPSKGSYGFVSVVWRHDVVWLWVVDNLCKTSSVSLCFS